MSTTGDESEGVPPYKDREEYIGKLKQWLEDARRWHEFCSGLSNPASSIQNPNTNLIYPNVLFQRQLSTTNTVPVLPQQQPNAYEFVIPPIWKRIAAELVDFFILFIIKMALTFILLESFNLISFEYYGLESFQKNLQNPKIAMQMSVELITLDTLHRVVVCAYEAYFLKGGMCATPGKRYMGLMVVSVDTVHPVLGRPHETVTVPSISPLGLQKSIIRAVLKNLFFGLLLPVCFALYVFRYNRTGYDMVANSLVVEYNPNFVNFEAAR